MNLLTLFLFRPHTSWCHFAAARPPTSRPAWVRAALPEPGPGPALARCDLWVGRSVRFIIDERTQHQMSGINHVLMDPDAFHEEEFTSCCLYCACLPFIRRHRNTVCKKDYEIFKNYSIGNFSSIFFKELKHHFIWHDFPLFLEVNILIVKLVKDILWIFMGVFA